MPIDPSATIPPDTPLSKIPNFDPREVPVVGVDTHLPPVSTARMAPDALRWRFGHPPHWQPELQSERRFTDRQPAEASVLVPVVMRKEPMVLLTERTAHLTTHKGQVAFPGGKRDDTDLDAADTALREAEEEIGLHRDLAEVIGTMPTYTTGTMFIITPVVALVKPDYRLVLNEYEVADAFEVPLSFLMDPHHHRRHAIELGGVRREWFSMPYTDERKERFIWGATAAMIRNFYRFLAA
ncbi:CoA pyrophosphatase [Ramlibacter sp. USB13]|uniref:CoA pyrophosphatase n=1 Tax=Ramlibacter cellulosilyticus TaxID=2764187 RepID=A0A923MS93_9BURK|nr:CoA pyrophosphatase [Ramlibacter cellulosilyticus]MBC5784245.1 CoA pyrophosphatase [Ramlibacter cellulosilyticus]